MRMPSSRMRPLIDGVVNPQRSGRLTQKRRQTFTFVSVFRVRKALVAGVVCFQPDFVAGSTFVVVKRNDIDQRKKVRDNNAQQPSSPDIN